ncbi:MAG TPA: hypothetical protein VGU90_02380 [Terriglobales bacterium]|nr:hypothetical protein [Terriglobales bacterium]
MFFLRYYLWFAPEFLLAIYLAVLLRRKQTAYPVFISYLAFKLMHGLLMIGIDYCFRFSPTLVAAYRSVLVIGNGIGAVLEIAVVYELADQLIRPSSYLAGILRPLLRWMVAFLILAGAIASALLSYSGDGYLVTSLEIVQLSSSLLRLGLLVTLVVFSRTLHVSWRSLPTGVALGFGLWAFGQVLGSIAMSKLGSNGYIPSDIVSMAAFHVCVVTWLIYAFRTADIREMTGTGFQQSDLDLWNQQVERMLKS